VKSNFLLLYYRMNTNNILYTYSSCKYLNYNAKELHKTYSLITWFLALVLSGNCNIMFQHKHEVTILPSVFILTKLYVIVNLSCWFLNMDDQVSSQDRTCKLCFTKRNWGSFFSKNFNFSFISHSSTTGLYHSVQLLKCSSGLISQ